MTNATNQPGAGDIEPQDGLVSELRRDGDLIMTGAAGYVDDLPLGHVAHAAILRSPHPHARIVAIDVEKVKAARNVLAVLTGDDLVGMVNPLPHLFDPKIFGLPTAEFYALATEKVRWVGEPVAAVAAETLADAERALDLIDVVYEEIPFVTDAVEAMARGAPKVFDHWEDNVLAMFPFEEGDVDAAIAASTHVIKDVISIQRFQAAPMECRGYVGDWTRGGKITIHASTQQPHQVRTKLSVTLGVTEANIRVVQPRVGGSFGLKFHGYQEESLVCLLSRLAGRPVKWLETRAESLLIGAREFRHEFRVGFEPNGRINGVHNRSIGNIGCLSTWGGWSMVYPNGMSFPGPYAIKNYKMESYGVVTNKAPWSGARGYGKESATLVIERIVDLVAKKIGMDAIDVRRVNFIASDQFPYWTRAKHLDSGDYQGALDQVVELSGYHEWRRVQRDRPADGPLLGVGVAFDLTPEGADASSLIRGHDTTTVRVSPNGAVSVLTGVTSSGTGNETSIAALVAREFGVHPSTVSVFQGDTDISPYGFGSFSGRSLVAGGGAGVLAAREIKDKLRTAASVLLEVEPGDVVFSDGQVRSAANPSRAMDFALLCEQIYSTSYVNPGLLEPQLEATCTYRPGNVTMVPDEHGRISPYPCFPYSAHVAVVEIDRETGYPRVIDYSCVHDSGTVISPKLVDSQLNGAIVMGIGGALYESQPFDDKGHPEALTFKQYLLPRATDLPTIRLGTQVTPSPFTLFGAKGAGESGVGGALASVAIAVNDALEPVGVTVHQLPLTPSRILDALLSSDVAR
ncbi:xanthine dehydrogenase family protein molybdopterin-binding subunit [Phytohabitans flavus]|uniref:Carbon monoxide dehydrogenase n=1 Tax=Phytohabitans flavus TaxID=1076124 RepID=A0A6F8XMV9_9ACTN|nr:xanthine dehydrogenase family protein molybdopterin-binding subunit [Phytohabitans flavus]BCB75118.1 carbon monoxide dehydrogenase [Phytohabitans flavus]